MMSTPPSQPGQQGQASQQGQPSQAGQSGEKNAAELLLTPVQYLKGAGAQRAEMLARLDVRLVRDLLYHFPRDYQDLVQLDSLDELEPDKLVRLRGTVAEFEMRGGRSGRSILGVLVRLAQGSVRALWFNQPFMHNKFQVGQHVLLAGKAKFSGGVWQLVHPNVQWLQTEDQPADEGLLPVYPLTEGLGQAALRRLTRLAIDQALPGVDEVLPEQLRARHELLSIHDALRLIHYPPSAETLATARRRLVYQELLVLQLALAVRRVQNVSYHAPQFESTTKIDARIRRLFPFEFTAGQQQAIEELRVDLAQPHPMNRLLQGDVGSGKTAVALYAVLLAVAHGHQAAIMAPTEILARQHAETLGRVLSSSRVRWKCLTGGMASRTREEIVAQTRAGELDVLIGTQAILQADVEFARLGLVVIDEQHKFGVRQRASLKQAALAPHYLVMTATPIPRSVALSLYGDLEISTLRDAPAGRQKVQTYLAEAAQRAQWWDFFRRKLREGRQGYVIAPLVESELVEPVAEAESAASIAGAEQLYESLVNGELADFRVGLLHGRLSPREKDATMEAFRSGKLQVLVATTVIEVGIDVPNATLLTIEAGERFGLAQLHQIRGRIARGTHQGFCCVFADPRTDDSRTRLQAFAGTSDGFELAEVDFAHRGPGDLLGTRQHGLPPLRIADLARDRELLELARVDAREMVVADPGLARPEYARLRRMMLVRYGAVLELSDVG